MNSPEIKAFIKGNSALFWWIKAEEKENISLDFLVETILNYGNEQSVKKLFELVGIKQVAEIFYRQTSRQRVNYHPRTVHYFTLYFQRHVPEVKSLVLTMPDENMKILSFEELAEKIHKLKVQGKMIVHCHGCFDLMHPGHIKYFQAAKHMGDILVVTVTPDRYVDKGPDRPVFNETLRAESIAALECVDYVAINQWPTAVETLRLLRPHFYVKGQEFEQLEDKTGKLQQEYAVVTEIGAEIRFTHEIVFSSTKLLREYF